VHAVDVTCDGYTDIVLADDEGKHLYLYRNMDGAGDEWARFLIKWGWWFSDVDAADFNGDGRTDILAAALVGTEVSWHKLTGNTSGWLESSILDITGYPEWDSITWTSEEPAGTDIFFQLRTSNDWENMGVWSDTIFQPRSLEGIIDSTHRYIQYRVFMTAEDEFTSPILDEIRVYWSNLGIEEGEGALEFTVDVFPNPSGGAVSISVPPLFSCDTELRVYDIAGKLVRTLSGMDGSVLQWDCSDASGAAIPSGLYIVQGTAEDRSASVRFVKL